jgi:hypothetical protein
MPSRCCYAIGVLVSLAIAGIPGSSASAQTTSAPAMTASPPQQMPISGTPSLYPSTLDPTATAPAYPSTSYPSTESSLPPAVSNIGQPAKDTGPVYTPYGSPEAMTASFAAPHDIPGDRLLNSNESYEWQLLPTGLMYQSYLAGNREPRIGSQIVSERNHGWLWDGTVGGRVGILRYGTDNSVWPQGWQFDIEGAAFPRLDLEHNEDLISVDFRAGFLSTTRLGPWETKIGYYHLSSHLGDEYMIRYPSSLATRLNYSRDSLIAGVAVYMNPSLRLYSEVGWAFYDDGGAKPWEFQFGADYSSTEPTGICGAPFFAINGHLRQDNDFSGNMTVQTGWQWRGRTSHLLRMGMQYFNGMSDQYQFYNRFEEQIGFGLWYDY